MPAVSSSPKRVKWGWQANGDVRGVGASGLWLAAVIGADNPVIAGQRRSSGAGAVLAGVIGCAHILIVTRGNIGDEATALGGITAVVGARVVVVTGDLSVSHTGSVCAAVVRGAGVVVIAFDRIVRIGAPDGRVTAVICAHIVVITIGRWPSDTRSIRTPVRGGTCVPIIAFGRVVLICAACLGVTCIVCTAIGVITAQWWSAETGSFCAGVFGAACIFIVARG